MKLIEKVKDLSEKYIQNPENRAIHPKKYKAAILTTSMLGIAHLPPERQAKIAKFANLPENTFSIYDSIAAGIIANSIFLTSAMGIRNPPESAYNAAQKLNSFSENHNFGLDEICLGFAAYFTICHSARLAYSHFTKKASVSPTVTSVGIYFVDRIGTRGFDAIKTYLQNKNNKTN